MNLFSTIYVFKIKLKIYMVYWKEQCQVYKNMQLPKSTADISDLKIDNSYTVNL